MEPSEDNAVAAAQTHSESSSGIRQSVCTVHVCTSCRSPGTPREPEENRPGFLLYRRLKEALKEGDFDAAVNVEPTPCLSVCPRPCGIALSLSGSWTYLFGDQDPEKTVRDVVKCVSIYLNSAQGYMPRNTRPEALRRAILGRVPPIMTNDS